MATSHYIEDIFSDFYNLVVRDQIDIDRQDYSAANSFSRVIDTGNQLTKNQANFIIKILQKYKNFSKMAGLDYEQEIKSPVWKNSFRVLDLSKKIFVEEDENKELWIMIKFPFALKEEFEKEINQKNNDYSSSIWDSESRIRKLKFYSYNLVEIYEFVQKHNFEIDETFMSAVADVEEIWQNSEEISPASDVVNDQVVLINSTTSAENYFNENKSGTVAKDLMLAKNMGYFYKKSPKNPLEKIASVEDKVFHIKNNSSIFDIYKSINDTIAVVVGSGDNSKSWVKNFTANAIKNGVDPTDIRICFRENKNSDPGFNQWIKDSGYGGKVEDGKIFIFQNKPPKWLFSKNIDVKIIITNSLFPVPNATTQAWMESHPCVCYVGDIKASQPREIKIVEL